MDNKQTSLRSSKKTESRLKGARKAAGVDLNDSSGGLQTALSDKLFTDAGVSMDRLFTVVLHRRDQLYIVLFIVCTFVLCHHIIW